MARKKKVEEAPVEAPAQEETQEAVQTEAPGPELSLQDLVAVRNIIDIASQRGAFRAGELEPVGKAYNKLNTFLDAALPKPEDAEQAKEAKSEA